ncbi:MAG: DapH/DapD/GlmU-related protein [Helicobacter sp.]|nr:DapH/DapD/GlmU-related protein [Helicobacter sp.]
MISKSAQIHNSCFIDSNVEIMANVKIWHFSHILSGVKIYENVSIGQNASIGPNVVIKSNCRIQNNVSIFEGVHLEDGVFIGPSVVFTNVLHPRAFINQRDKFKATQIGSGASIGANATIVCGIKIGKYAFIGAGSVVTKDVGDFELVFGNPARHRGYVCKCGKKLHFKDDMAFCEAENIMYRKTHLGVTHD